MFSQVFVCTFQVSKVCLKFTGETTLSEQLDLLALLNWFRHGTFSPFQGHNTTLLTLGSLSATVALVTRIQGSG